MQHGDPASFQEERRLLFVGVTRAMQELNLTQTRRRNFRGSWRYTISSPYVPEMDLEVVCEDNELPPPVQQNSVVDERIEKARLRYEAAQKQTNKPMLISAADLEKKLLAENPDEASDSTKSSGQQDTKDEPAVSGALAETKAALQLLTQKKMQASNSSTQFLRGEKVRHPRYGRGTVVDVSAGSSRATVTVVFEVDDRKETFVAAHCPLQPVGPRPK